MGRKYIRRMEAGVCVCNHRPPTREEWVVNILEEVGLEVGSLEVDSLEVGSLEWGSLEVASLEVGSMEGVQGSFLTNGQKQFSACSLFDVLLYRQHSFFFPAPVFLNWATPPSPIAALEYTLLYKNTTPSCHPYDGCNHYCIHVALAFFPLIQQKLAHETEETIQYTVNLAKRQ